MNLPLKDFCKNLKALPEDKINSLKLRRSEVTGEIETECFLERMDEYLEVSLIYVRIPCKRVMRSLWADINSDICLSVDISNTFQY